MIDEHENVVTISSDKPLRLSPDAMRALKKATSRSMSELLNDEDDEGNRLQVMAFAELPAWRSPRPHGGRRDVMGPRPAVMEIEFTAPEAFRPLKDVSLPTSPPSVDIGE